MKHAFILTPLLLLAACAGAEERTQQQAQRQIAACTQAGYRPGTSAFDECRAQLQEREEQRRTDRLSAIDDLSTSNHYDGGAPSGLRIPLP